MRLVNIFLIFLFCIHSANSSNKMMMNYHYLLKLLQFQQVMFSSSYCSNKSSLCLLIFSRNYKAFKAYFSSVIIYLFSSILNIFGIFLNKLKVTFFASKKTKEIFWGLNNIILLKTKHFKKFDLPNPVYPVTRQCGYYYKSTIILLLVDSSIPKIRGILYFYNKNSLLSIIFLKLKLLVWGKYMSIWKVPFLNFSYSHEIEKFITVYKSLAMITNLFLSLKFSN